MENKSLSGVATKTFELFGKFLGIDFVLLFLFISIVGKSTLDNIVFTVALFLFTAYLVAKTFYALNIDMQNSKPKQGLISKLNSLEFKRFDEFPIYYTDNSESHARYVLDYLKEVKEHQKAKFVEKGFIIVVENYPFMREHKLTNAMGEGIFDSNQKVIFLSQSPLTYMMGESAKRANEFFKRTFFHEWGHFLDYMYGLPSYTYEVLLEYKKAKKIFSLKYHPSSLKWRLKYVMADMKLKKHNISMQPYELKNSGEFLAENYSKYRLHVDYEDGLSLLFEQFEEK